MSAGLSIDSTSKLREILGKGQDRLVLPLTIIGWDRELDERETNRRCFTENPWYLALYSLGDYLKENVSSDELVVTMGAGDIWKVADEYLQRLGTDS